MLGLGEDVSSATVSGPISRSGPDGSESIRCSSPSWFSSCWVFSCGITMVPGPSSLPSRRVVAVVAGLVAVLRGTKRPTRVSTAEPDHAQVQDVVNQENRIVQNHFASVARLLIPACFAGCSSSRS